MSLAALRAGIALVGRSLRRALLEPEYPLLAVEVRPRALAAVRLAREGGRLALAGAAVQALPEGLLDVSPGRPNVTDPGAFRRVLQAVLERAGALSGGPMSLVLPDPVVRTTLVPAAGLRGGRQEVEEAIRFRLHKALPFDVRSARLAWSAARADELLVAVAFHPAIEGYEQALAELGFQAGLVEATSLALLSLVEREPVAGDRLLVNWDETYVSFVLTRAGRPLLVRTLPGESDTEAVAAHAASTVRYVCDRFGGEGPEAVALRSACLPVAEAVEALRAALGLVPQPIRLWAAGRAEPEAAGHALAGAAASALRRAA